MERDARVAVLLEVEGTGDSLPPYAGNLDIMTAAAVRVGGAAGRRDYWVTRKWTSRITDTTLRDGSHAMAHQFTTQQVESDRARTGCVPAFP